MQNLAPGTWRIDAVLDPDNRLMVVTDLKLQVDGLPAGTIETGRKLVADKFDQETRLWQEYRGIRITG